MRTGLVAAMALTLASLTSSSAAAQYPQYYPGATYYYAGPYQRTLTYVYPIAPAPVSEFRSIPRNYGPGWSSRYDPAFQVNRGFFSPYNANYYDGSFFNPYYPANRMGSYPR